MMANTRPNHNGVLVGRVINVIASGRKNVMLISAEKDLNAHDVVEIRSDNRPTEPVYEFTLKDGKKKGESFEANFTKGLPVKTGLCVYRTKNEVLLNDINDNIILKPIKKRIKASFYAEADNELILTLYTDDSGISVNGAICMKAENRPVDEERVCSSLLKMGDTEFTLKREDIDVNLVGDVFFPMSALNELRRNACEALEAEIVGKCMKNKMKPDTEAHSVIPKPDFNPYYEVVVSDLKQLKTVLEVTRPYKDRVEIIINTELFGLSNLGTGIDEADNDERRLYLRLPEIFRRNNKEKYQRFFAKGNSGYDLLFRIKGFLVRNLEEISFVKELEELSSVSFDMIGDTNLYAFNSKAVETLSDFGIHHYTASLEQSIREAEEVRNNITLPSKLSFVAYGREELMVMTQCQWKNKGACVKELKKGDKRLPDILYIENKKSKPDGKRGKFPIVKDCESCTNYVYQDVPLNLFEKMDEIRELSPDYLRLDFSFETDSEVREVMKLAKFSK